MKATKGVPIPPPTKPARERKYPLDTMEVDDFFFVPEKLAATLSPHISRQGKLLKRKFTLRSVYAVMTKSKTWKLADEDTPGACWGVAVWRTK